MLTWAGIFTPPTQIKTPSNSDVQVSEFVRSLLDEFERIEKAFAALSATPDDEICRTVLFRLVQDLTGQADISDYPLISVFGTDLCRFLVLPLAMTSRRLKVVRLHVDAMKQVADKKITGDQDDSGLRIAGRLQSMIEMVSQEKYRYH